VESSQRWLHSRPRDLYLTRRSGRRSWLHLLVLALLATVLFVWPGVANADRTGPAARSAPLPTLNVAVIGDVYSYGYSASSDVALRHSVPPTLQALNQIQAANPRVRIEVLFIPVATAVGGGLSRTVGSGKQGVQSALIDAVRSANVVIDGLAVGNARFASMMRSVLFDAGASSKTLLQLTSVFGTGAYLQAETALLSDIAKRVAPGSAIVTLGYPKVMAQPQSSGSLAWWSPFTGGTISQQQASMSDQLTSALDTANDQATSIIGAKYSRLHLLFTDFSAAASGSASGAAAPSAQMIIGNELLPYLDQAVNDELAARGIEGATSIRPVTPGAPWYLSVQLPVRAVAPKPGRSGSSWSRQVGPKSRVTANSRVNTASARPPARALACALVPTARRTFACGGRACGILCRGSGNGGRRPVVPGLGFRAPPGPLPRPIAPRQPASANPGSSSGTSPSQGGSGSGNNSGQSSSEPGTSGSGAGTTSSGPGTTSSGGGTTSGFGSPSGGGTSSGAGSASGGGSSSGGGSASGGGSSGGGSSGGAS
jgi:hypothetical protein